MSMPTLRVGEAIPLTLDQHKKILRLQQYRIAWEQLIATERSARRARIRPEVKARIQALVDRVDQADPAAAVRDIKIPNPGWRSALRGRKRRRKRGTTNEGLEIEEATRDEIDPGAEGVMGTATVDEEAVDIGGEVVE